MPHPLPCRLRRWVALCGTAALLALPLPALAQDATAPDTAAAPPVEPQECTPGAFGDGAILTPSESESDAVTAIYLEFQCGDILSDGTFIPTGYRVELEGECGDAACNYPLAFMVGTSMDGRFEGMFVSEEGSDVILRLRKNRNGALLVMITQTPGSGNKPERLRFQMSEN